MSRTGSPSVETVGTAVPVAPGRASPRVRQVSSYTELTARVRDAGLLGRQHRYYWTLVAALAAVMGGVVVAFAMLRDSWWQLVVAVVMAVVLAQLGFLGHDAAHRQVFRSARWNIWSARIVSTVGVGLSYGWWTHKHNRHHSGPNQEGRDPDIGPGALAFTPAIARTRTQSPFPRWFVRHQGLLFFPLLCFEGIALHVAGIRTLIERRDLEHRLLEGALVILRLGGYLAVLFLLLPPSKAIAFLGVQLAVFGVLLGGAFAPNHKGMPIVPKDARVDFLQRQVLMSRNVRGGRALDLAMGGLNYQIEHHLFPSMPRPNLRRARPIVQAFCREHDITYTEMSLVASYGTVVRYLNAVGLHAHDPFACPLIREFRVE